MLRRTQTGTIFLLMNATMRNISPGELLFSLENCCSTMELQSCSIDFINADFQLTVEKQLAITKSGEGNVCSKKEKQFGQGLYISVLIL